jgi:transposase, IS30 family
MYGHISFRERERIGILQARGMKVPSIAQVLGRDPTTIRRELKRVKSKYLDYSPLTAQADARTKQKIPRREKKLQYQPLWRVVHRKLELCWSPEQIAHYLKAKYAGNTRMHISHEAIYTYIYVLPRGKLRKELISFLRQGSRGRQRRKRDTDERGKIPNMISIRERPKEVENRTIPGHWESDLVIGKANRSAIGTLVERTTRTTILVPLKAKDAMSVRKEFARTVKLLPKEVFRSLTHDRGSEMYEHELFTKDTDVQVYFADPHSPWQRGTNENTNGLIRQFFPKGTDFSQVSRRNIKRVQRLLNERPRKVLDWRTPKEAFATLFEKRALGVRV